MRLIDADKLLMLINEQKEKETGSYSKGRNEGLNIAKSIINDEIQTPIAYDVDKVVEELEKSKEVIATTRYCRKYVNNGSCDEKDCFKCIADYLIDIVKAGGKNE